MNLPSSSSAFKSLFAGTALALTALLALPGHALAQTTAEAPRVKFITSEGEFTVEVYPDKAPKTVANFLQYVKDRHYNGTVFHRVMNNFMVQGGGFDARYVQKPTRPPSSTKAEKRWPRAATRMWRARWPWPARATRTRHRASFSSMSKTTIF
jgi:hypothetical protein